MLVGGYAVNFHGHHRTTGDMDLWIAVDASNAERVSKALQKFGFSPQSVPSRAFLEQGKIFRFGIPPVRIELLTQPTGVEFEDCFSRRVMTRLDGIDVPVISLEDLKLNKKAAGRGKDLLDLESLP